MNWNFLAYGFLSLLFSSGWYIYSKRWRVGKKQRIELDNFDRGTIIPRDWLITISFGAIGIVYLFKFFLIK